MSTLSLHPRNLPTLPIDLPTQEPWSLPPMTSTPSEPFSGTPNQTPNLLSLQTVSASVTRLLCREALIDSPYSYVYILETPTPLQGNLRVDNLTDAEANENILEIIFVPLPFIPKTMTITNYGQNTHLTAPPVKESANTLLTSFPKSNAHEGGFGPGDGF